MFGFILVIIAFLIGFPIAHYTSFLINNSEDCEKQITFSFLSVRSITICFISSVLWLIIYLVCGISVSSVIYMIASSILLAISVVDFAVYEIPFQFNVVLAVLGIAVLLMDITHWYEYVIGFFAVSGIFLLMAVVTKGNGMGGGDVKLMAAAGLLLGWKKILFAMVIGSVLGILVHGVLMIVLKKKHMLAFGPYLSMAVYIMTIYGDKLLGWYVNTFFNFTY